MKFLNKVNRYKTTILYQMIEILRVINKDMFLTEIYRKISSKMNVREFYGGMRALFAIKKVEFLKDGRIRKC